MIVLLFMVSVCVTGFVSWVEGKGWRWRRYVWISVRRQRRGWVRSALLGGASWSQLCEACLSVWGGEVDVDVDVDVVWCGEGGFVQRM